MIIWKLARFREGIEPGPNRGVTGKFQVSKGPGACLFLAKARAASAFTSSLAFLINAILQALPDNLFLHETS